MMKTNEEKIKDLINYKQFWLQKIRISFRLSVALFLLAFIGLALNNATIKRISIFLIGGGVVGIYLNSERLHEEERTIIKLHGAIDEYNDEKYEENK